MPWEGGHILWSCHVFFIAQPRRKGHKIYGICKICILVGGLEHVLFFPILGIVTPTDFHIQRRRAQPPTSIQQYELLDSINAGKL